MASTGSLTASGTAAQLIGTATPVKYQTTIVAAGANTGTVYVGFASTVTANSTAATDGFELVAKASITVSRDSAADASAIYVIASASSQKVFFLAD